MGALGEFYDAHAVRVYHVLLANGLTEPEAQDALQEVFLALAARGRKLVGVQSGLAYLLGIARKQAHQVRQRRPRPQPETAPEPLARAAEPADGLAARQLVAQLPPEQAEVMVLKIWHELTFAEIAAALDISANTAASRYRYALEKLRDLWETTDERQ